MVVRKRRTTRRSVRYQYLRANRLTPIEAREFSVLPKSTPALKGLVVDRNARWERFVKIANSKLRKGKWRQRDLPSKWLANLSRMYHKRGWRVKEGPRGRQKPMAKGSVNPWAMYRSYERQFPGKGYRSPWEIKQVRGGKTPFDRGQVFIQKAEKGVGKSTIQHWIDQLTESIRLFPQDRERFETQREKLRGML